MPQRFHATAERLFRYSLTLSVLLSGFVLGLYALLGTYVRMIADDFCFAYTAREQGMLDSVISAYTTQNSRYTDFFIEYSLSTAEPALNSILPALTVLALIICLIYTLFQLRAYLHIAIQSVYIYVGAIVIAFVFYRLMPSYQHAFWSSAIIAYTWVIILITFYFGTLFQFLHQSRSPRSLIFYLLWTVFFMLFIGGLHELSITTLIGLFGFLLLVSLIFPSDKRRVYLSIFTTGFMSLGATLLIVLLSPGVNNRRAIIADIGEAESTLTLWEAIPQAITFTLAYIFGEPLGITFGQTYAIAFLLTLFICIIGWGLLYLSDHTERTLPGGTVAGRLFWMTGAVGMGAIFAVIFPSVYGANGAVPMRAIIFARTVQIAMFLIWSYVALLYAQKYNLLSRLRRTATWSPVLIATAFLLIWTPAVSMYKLATLFPDYQAYAQAWDERHQALIDEPDDASVTITPLAYNIEDSLVLKVAEDDPTFWINGCMARFYDLESVIVVPSDNDE